MPDPNRQPHKSNHPENDIEKFFENIFEKGTGQNGSQTKNLNDLPPEARAFIGQNLHKAEKYLENPIIKGFLELSGINLNELKSISGSPADGFISITTQKKTSSSPSSGSALTGPAAPGVPSLKQTYSSALKQKSAASSVAGSPAFRPPIPASRTPLTFNNKLDTHDIVGIIAAAGAIIWLLYQFTDII